MATNVNSKLEKFEQALDNLACHPLDQVQNDALKVLREHFAEISHHQEEYEKYKDDPRRRSEHQQRVDEFMQKANQEMPAEPTIPSLEIRTTRARLLLEECLETIEALGFETEVTYLRGKLVANLRDCLHPNLQLIADGCADTSVVTVGTLSACGISDISLLEEVDSSNLSKFELPQCPGHGDTMLHSHDGHYRCTVPIKLGAGETVRCEVQRSGPYNKDGKWIKGPDYRPADIERVLKAQMLPKPLLGVDECKCAEANAASTNDEAAKRWPPDLLVRAKEQLVALHEFDAAKTLVTVLRKLGMTEDSAQILVGTKLESPVETIARLTSGAGKTAQCHHCRAPLSDELARKLTAPEHRKDIFKCPQCLGILIGKELKYA